jgi:catechol 2,3-dioxygenase-like lactoylglutathione lyase family enzyme
VTSPDLQPADQYASVRYLVDDVQAAVDFYTGHFGFTLRSSAAPAFADVVRGPSGRNRIHLSVDDLDAEVGRLRDAGLEFRSDVVRGPGGQQVLVADPAGNLVELFEPARPTQ